jgi:[protein-PII] uridylyltransferase
VTMGAAHDPASSPSPTVDTSTVGAVLAEQRRIIGQRVMEGATGAETMAAMTELVDGLIVGRYRNAVRQGGEAVAAAGLRQCCLVALGGYGRRELAPHSDIDLMFLFRPEAKPHVESLVRLRVSGRA